MRNVPIRVLLVEDSEDDAELIRIELEAAGFLLDWKRVETEDSFVAGLRERWDVIISDFKMPQFNGLRAFALFTQSGLDIPFIFVSGAIGEDRAVEAMRAGARDYLLKGNLARLSVAVTRELDQARNRHQLRSAEEAAQRQQRRLAMAVEASGAGVFEHRIPVADDIYMSERCGQILGCSEKPAMETQDRVIEWALEKVHEDDVPLLVKAYGDFIAGHTERCAAEVRVAHPHAQWVNVAGYAKAIERDDEGRATSVVGVVLDVSEQRSLEGQFRQAQKMEAVGRLAGGVAHDFNNLLTAIFSFGKFVLDELPVGEPVYEDMMDVLDAAKKAEALTAQLLAFSRSKPVSPRVININDLVGDMDRMLRRIVGEDVDVTTTFGPRLWNVRADPGSIEQVIVNLAVNARDAMERGGKLSIETRNVVLDAPYVGAESAEALSGECVVVTVSDDGVGMDSDLLCNIFEPFFTTKAMNKGTGLGLSTCYGIIKQAGGVITAESVPGEGTTFSIKLPRVVEAAERVEFSREPSSLLGDETVLVVEDDEQVRRLATRTLSALGYRVIEAASGREALLHCDRASEDIALLLTDVVMPEMSGKELVELIAARQPTLKVLYMSGYTENAIAHRGVIEPGTHMLPKPFTPEQLGRKVRQMLDNGP